MATPTAAELVAAIDAAVLDSAGGYVSQLPDGQGSITFPSLGALLKARDRYAALAARQSKARPRLASIKLPGAG